MRINFRNITLNQLAPLAGLTGCAVIGFGLFASASHYIRPMVYSPRNHFISELGLAEASDFAHVFNLCLNTGGIMLLLFVYGLGSYLYKTPLAKYATFIGMTATLSFSAIGYFTADSWIAHKNAASVFFTGAMLSIALFSYCIRENKQSKIHHFISIQGFLIVFIYALVLVLPKDLLTQSVNDPEGFVRPNFWDLTVLEWTYCLLICSWIVTVSIDLLYITYHKVSASAGSVRTAG